MLSKKLSKFLGSIAIVKMESLDFAKCEMNYSTFAGTKFNP